MPWISTQTASAVLGAMVMALVAVQAQAVDLSFTGNFTRDDNVQLFNFTTDGSSTVVLRTWSYAGGTNAAGNTIARGGFDPILALFDSTGAYINQNDDGGCSYVAADAVTGRCWDTYFSAPLAAGDYTVAIMQYNNFANGPNLSNGFQRDGQGNYTAGWCGAGRFCDVAYDARDGHWAFDILNVVRATQGGPAYKSAPLPALSVTGLGMLSLALGLAATLGLRRKILESRM
jgi:hypothetical protein